MAEATHPVPGAWYDIAYRVSAIKAVAGTISQVLPCGNIPPHLMQEISDAGYIAGVIVDLLELTERDVERLERELKTGVPQ